MTDKRKSMNGSDAHAYKLRRSVAIAKQCSKGYQGMLPRTSFDYGAP